jgi:hypothetical protein
MLTVIIPSHKARSYLPLTLQGYPTPEQAPWLDILVVITGEDDGSKSWLRDHYPHVRTVDCKIANINLARQVGMAQSSSKYIAFRDPDDAIPPGSLNSLVEYLENHPELDGVSGYVQMTQNGIRLFDYHYTKGCDEVFVENILQIPFLMTASVFRRTSVNDIVFPMYRIGEDWAVVWDACLRGLRFTSVDVLALIYNRHAYANTANMPAGNDLLDFVTSLRAQMLAQCGIVLDAAELLDFVNIAPCSFWTLDQVPHWKTMAPTIRKARVRSVFDKVIAQNQRLPKAALERRLNEIYATLPAWF